MFGGTQQNNTYLGNNIFVEDCLNNNTYLGNNLFGKDCPDNNCGSLFGHLVQSNNDEKSETSLEEKNVS